MSLPRTCLAVLVFMAAGLAGCTGSGGDDGFDGQATWDWVDAIVYDPEAPPGPDGSSGLRARVPEHPDHAEAAAWLADAMQLPGWTVETHTFTGEEVQALDHGPVNKYATRCGDDDKNGLPQITFYNLAARLPGPDGAPTFALGAHWDAKEEAMDGGPMPAANDGASGVAVLLQLQRELEERAIELPYELLILFFDGEDGFEDCHPLAGSLHYAQTIGDVDRFLLLDMVGDPEAAFIREAHSTASDPAMMDLLWDLAPSHGLEDNFLRTSKAITDDHIPFIEQGVPAADLIDAGRSGTFPPYWHTGDDTPDKVTAGMLGRVGGLVLDVVQSDELAAVDGWPARA